MAARRREEEPEGVLSSLRAQGSKGKLKTQSHSVDGCRRRFLPKLVFIRFDHHFPVWPPPCGVSDDEQEAASYSASCRRASFVMTQDLITMQLVQQRLSLLRISGVLCACCVRWQSDWKLFLFILLSTLSAVIVFLWVSSFHETSLPFKAAFCRKSWWTINLLWKMIMFGVQINPFGPEGQLFPSAFHRPLAN